ETPNANDQRMHPRDDTRSRISVGRIQSRPQERLEGRESLSRERRRRRRIVVVDFLAPRVERRGERRRVELDDGLRVLVRGAPAAKRGPYAGVTCPRTEHAAERIERRAERVGVTRDRDANDVRRRNRVPRQLRGQGKKREGGDASERTEADASPPH